MKAYYEENGITIYHGDCRDVLPSLQPEAIDLLITDPPYGESYKPTGMRSLLLPTVGIANDDGSLDVLEILNLSLRVLRAQRHLYVFGPFDLTAFDYSVEPYQRLVEAYDRGDKQALGAIYGELRATPKQFVVALKEEKQNA